MSRALLVFTDSETSETTCLIADCYVDSDTICGVIRRADLAIDPELTDTYDCSHYQVGVEHDVFHVAQTSIRAGGPVKVDITGYVYRNHAHTDKAELEMF